MTESSSKYIPNFRFALRRDLDKRVPYERGRHHRDHVVGDAEVPPLKPSWAAGGKFGQGAKPHDPKTNASGEKLIR